MSHELSWKCVRDDDEFDVQDYEADVPDGVYQIGVSGSEVIWGYEFGDPNDPDEEEFFEAESFETAMAAAQEHWAVMQFIEQVELEKEIKDERSIRV